MYDALRPDIVVVATQTRGHHGPAVAALRRGIAVLCEKPIAIDLAEADEMVTASQDSGAKFAIHQQNHVHPGIRKARELVEKGLIGDLVLVRGRNKAGRRSGNEFMEMGTHVTDMMLRFASPPEWSSGTVYYAGQLARPEDIMEAKQMSPGDRDSGLVLGARAVGQYGFRGGVLGEVHFLDFRRTTNTNYGVDVVGLEGQLAVRPSASLTECLWHLPRPLEGRPSQASDWSLVDVSDVGVEEPMATMYRGLAHAIETDTAPPCDGQTGRWAFEMILGIYASHREDGRRVPLPLVRRRHPLAEWREAVAGDSPAPAAER
jgi:predicted dehydrogenase